MLWYPLIGLGLGAAGGGIYWGGRLYLPELLSAVLAIVLLQAMTGALHLDGLMDTCDGLGSGAPRERALEIMRDSRIGAMGVFGAITQLLVKVAALVALTPQQALIPLMTGLTAARLVPVIDATLFPYARPEGTGRAFAQGGGYGRLSVAAGLTLATAWLVGQAAGLVICVIAVGLTLLAQLGISRRLGGLTGDVYGLGIELAEALALVSGCIFAKWTFI